MYFYSSQNNFHSTTILEAEQKPETGKIAEFSDSILKIIKNRILKIIKNPKIHS